MSQNVCVVPHPEENRPCSTRFAHSLESCPQCGGTVSVDETEFERLMAELVETEVKPALKEEKTRRTTSGKPKAAPEDETASD